MIRADEHHTTLPFSLSDARKLPYPDHSFERVICGFLLRNVRDYPTALTEIYRVLKPGGKFVSLDTTPAGDKHFQPIHLAAYAGSHPDRWHTGHRADKCV